MKALPWQGSTNVEVLDVPDPVIEEATDVIITVTSTGSAIPTCTCTACSAPT
jgi:threonine dehydrogenase-like Zn-dependent dehydrogenase